MALLRRTFPSRRSGRGVFRQGSRVYWTRRRLAARSNVAGKPLLSTISDDFTSGLGAIWTQNNGSPTGTDGRARIPCATGYDSIRSASIYTIAGASVSARLTPPGWGGATTDANIGMSVNSATAGTSLSTVINRFAGTITFSSEAGYFDASAVSLTYDPTAHAFCQIRESGGTVFWETSTSGTSGTWTTRKSVTTPAWVATDNQDVQFTAHRDAGTSDHAEVDYFNTTPTATGGAALNLWKSTQPVDSYSQLSAINQFPHALWVGDWDPNPDTSIAGYATSAARKTMVLPIYAIPNRDSGGYSGGGFPDQASYLAWITKVKTGAGTAPVWYILEPDALGLASGFSAPVQAERLDTLAQAVTILKQGVNARVYIDASFWLVTSTAASLLQSANIAAADGFSTNVSAYETVDDCYTWADQVVTDLAGLGITGKRYVIDSGRAGRGKLTSGFGTEASPWVTAGKEYINPPGRGLGLSPRVPTGHANCAALLWIKGAGGSDGNDPGTSFSSNYFGENAPGAGTFWVRYAENVVAFTDPANLDTSSLSPSVQATASVSAATGDAPDPTLSISQTVTPTAAGATGDAPDPSVKTSESHTASVAQATGTALNPTTTISESRTATAGVAATSGAALDATTGSSQVVTAGPASATGDAPDPTTAILTVASVAQATGDAPDPTPSTSQVVTAGLASATGAAPGPTTTISESHTAAVAQATGDAPDPTVTISESRTVTAGVAQAAGAALDASATAATSQTVTAGLASATGAAPGPTTAIVTVASVAQATGAAPSSTTTISESRTATAGVALATGAAPSSTTTISESRTVTAGVAQTTGAALDPTTSISESRTATPGVALATGAANNATAATAVSTTAGVATATGAAGNGALVAAARPSAAAAAGQALDPTPVMESQGTAFAGTAGATGFVDFDTAASVGLTLIANDAVTAGSSAADAVSLAHSLADAAAPGAAGAAVNPSVTAQSQVTATTAVGSGQANDALGTSSSNATVTAGTASAAGAANTAAGSAVTAGLSPATTTGQAPSVALAVSAYPASAATSGQAPSVAPAVSAYPVSTAVTGQAPNPATSTSSAANAMAGTATTTGQAPSVVPAVSAHSGSATVTGQAPDAATSTASAATAVAGTAGAAGTAGLPTTAVVVPVGAAATVQGRSDDASAGVHEVVVTAGTATAWATAQGGSVTVDENEPGPTQIALAETADGVGRTFTAQKIVLVRPVAARATGATSFGALSSVSGLFRPYSGTPVLAPSVHAGAPTRSQLTAGEPTSTGTVHAHDLVLA